MNRRNNNHQHHHQLSDAIISREERNETRESCCRRYDDDDDGVEEVIADDDNNDKQQHRRLVATSDMCYYCFDTLLAELLLLQQQQQPESSEDHRGQSSRSSSSTRRNHTTKLRTKTKTPLEGSSCGNSMDEGANAHDASDQTQQETQSWCHYYAPPDIDCPLFVTWSKLRSKHPPPPLPLLSEMSSSSGLSTPVTTTASSTSNITDDVDVDDDIAEKADYDLRGCVGTLSPKSLQYALSEFAVTSALHDHRFDPISLRELPYLRVGVSLLVKYEVCDHCLDWEVGVHGIIIKFDHNIIDKRGIERRGGGRGDTTATYSATYLPEVAFEQKWTQQETVLSLVRKAGYRGVITDELLVRIRCTRYQSSKYQRTYQEYVMHRGIDPLQDLNINLAAAAVDEAMRNTGNNSSRHCINL